MPLKTKSRTPLNTLDTAFIGFSALTYNQEENTGGDNTNQSIRELDSRVLH